MEDAQTLIENTDYEILIAYDEEGSKEAGASIDVTITGIGNYTGSITNTFEIKPLSLDTDKVQVTYENGLSQIPEMVDYTDADIVFEDLQVTYDGAALPLEVEKDYSVAYENNKSVGTASIIISGNGNYTADKVVNFKIIGNLSDTTPGAVVVNPVEDQLYTMGGAEPEITVVYYGEELPDKYYTIEYADNEAVGTATARLVGDGVFCRGEVSTTFEVVERNLSENPEDGIFIEPEEEYIYNGKAIIPEAGDFILTKNEAPVNTELYDYEIVGYGENINAADKEAENAAYVEIAIVRKDGKACYTGTMNVRFTINPMPLADNMISVEDGVYNGSALEPKVTVAYKNAEGETITLSAEDYTLSWKNNVALGTKNAGEAAPTVVVEGKGNYEGTAEATFNIVARSMETYASDFQVVIPNQVFTGEAQIPSPVVVDKNTGATLVEGTDYTVSAGANNVKASSEATITITGKGNYTGTITPKFTILRKNIADQDIAISGITDKVFNGKAQTQAAVISWDDKKLAANTDFKITYENNVNAGTAYVNIAGLGNYTGSIRQTFKISQRALTDNGIVVRDIANQVYTGKALAPAPEVYYQDAAQGINTKLVNGTDYTVTYLNNTAVGKNVATVKITGKGNYSGTTSTTFTIVGNIGLAEISAIGTQNYTGSAVTPKPTVKQAGRTLTEGTDYKLSYTNNVNPGTATVTITGINEYGGSKTLTFNICRDISGGLQVVGLGDKYLYTGKAIVPALGKVSAYGQVLTLNKDYTVAVKNNVAVGTATLVVSGKGNYKGSKTYYFDITRRSISQCSVSTVSTKTYTGKAFKPGITVKYDGVTLKAGADYSLVYQNNTKPGTASIILKGKGNFNGSKIVKFQIKMAPVTGVKVASAGTTKIKVSWKKQSAVTGYQIYDSKNKKVAQVKGSSKTSYTISGLTAGKTYSYKVRTYVIKGGKTYYSAFTALKKTATKPEAPAVTVKSTKSKQAVISWKKVSGASGYEIYRSTKKSSGYKKSATTTKRTYTNKKLTANKKYYYKVRAYRTVDGKKIYSSYSSVKYVTIKK